jgi:hypothetical protein
MASQRLTHKRGINNHMVNGSPPLARVLKSGFWLRPRYHP